MEKTSNKTQHKTDSTVVGDTIYSLDGDEIKEWEIIMINPKNNRFFIVVNNETKSLKQIHWKTLEYGSDHVEFFSLSKTELIERYKNRSDYIIAKISKSE